jgi:GntR family transcriptional regulator/MocR family aminotransferase
VVETRANSIDLHLDVAGTRVRSGLESALREAIRTGRLAAGTRLPPSRALAADLGVARNTVADAYGQLVAEGWLAARTGAGTWVTRDPLPARQPPPAPVPQSAPPRYDLRAGVPDLSAFPRREWLAAARAALGAAPDHVLGYPDPRGLPQLREALAGYLARARGVSAAPGRIVVCCGFAHGLALLCRLLRARGGDTIAIEGYGHQTHRRLVESHGLHATPVPVDRDGAVPDHLSGAAAALLTPAHQFPLGVTLRPQRRRAVVAWASDTGGLVIEDDYDGEFRYDRQPVGAMQSLAPEHVAYAGTASKSLAPGLRLGWLVLPDHLVDEVVAVMESFPSSLEQLTLAAFLTSGGYDRQVRHTRLVYRRRRDRLVGALQRRVPAVRVTGIAAGLHALLELPGDRTEDDLVTRAATHGLAIDGLAGFTAPGMGLPPALVVGYARPPDHAFTTALARLCTVLN